MPEETRSYGITPTSRRGAGCHKDAVANLNENKFLEIVEALLINDLSQQLIRRLCTKFL